MKGQNFRILIGDKCVAFATACTYHLSTTLESASTKDDTDGFNKQEVVGYAGDISCDALYSMAADANGVNGVDALDLLLAGQEVTVKFSGTTSTQNRTPTGVAYTCQGIVNDISVNATNRQNVSYTIQIQMNSMPTKSGSTSTNI